MPMCLSCTSENATHGKKCGPKQYCKTCAQGLEGVGNLTRKCCKNAECWSEPAYNFFGEKSGIYCAKHKEPGMEDVKHKKCQHIDEQTGRCLKNATYGIEDGEKQKYCHPHSLLYDGMMVIRSKLCQHISDENVKCTKRAGWNVPGTKMGKWCKVHKKAGDEFVIKKLECIEEGCTTAPIYNYSYETKLLYCKLHKKPGMENISDKKCAAEGCGKGATHGKKGTNEKIFCGTHRQDGMVDNKSAMCQHLDCGKYATYSKKGTKIKIFCAEHADKSTMENNKSKKCIQCKERLAMCNYEGLTQRLYCCRCRLIGMVSLCVTICKNSYEVNGGIYKCQTRAQPEKYDGFCFRCFTMLFPEEPRVRNFRTKEYAVYEFIKHCYPTLDIVYDKVVKNGCSKRRPDMLIQMHSYNIIIEVDEEQHSRYEDLCENKRMMEIFMDLGNKPLVMIRFNPDDYYDSNGEKVKSCWSYNQQHIAIINRNKKNEWNERLHTLQNTLNNHIENVPVKDLDIVYLYFDHINEPT